VLEGQRRTIENMDMEEKRDPKETKRIQASNGNNNITV
jgi:hypothetical protein